MIKTTLQALTEIQETDGFVWMSIRGELENLSVVQDGILKVRHLAKMVEVTLLAKTKMHETKRPVRISLFSELNRLLVV